MQRSKSMPAMAGSWLTSARMLRFIASILSIIELSFAVPCLGTCSTTFRCRMSKSDFSTRMGTRRRKSRGAVLSLKSGRVGYNDRMSPVPVSTVHRLAPLQDKPPGQLLIHEIYRSVQGESTFAGLPCVFVRLTVCNSRCVWCDTPHAFTQGSSLSSEEILKQVQSYHCPLVEITGGEPLLQPEVLPLMTELANRGLTVLLETSGALDVSAVDPRVHIIMDLKCPDSGER